MKNRSSFEKDSSQLQQIFRFLNESWESYSLETKIKSELELAVEELFMNAVRHNTDDNSDVHLCVDVQSNSVEISVSSKEEKPFDITKTKKLDLDDYIAKQKSGGLGIHLIKEMMDDIRFDYSNGISTITIVKNLPA
ncbi:MAG: ATP-binding protein [Balneolaceae bacterium]|nr:ATP-binding protein [Balneolaceae bacterium]